LNGLTEQLHELVLYRKGVITGSTAGAFGQLVASPTDLVKVNMQMEGRRILEGHPAK